MTQKATCQICGKEITKADFDAKLVETVYGSDFVMYHHNECSKAVMEKQAQEAKAALETAERDSVQYDSIFATIVEEITNAGNLDDIYETRYHFKSLLREKKTELHRAGINNFAFLVAAQRVQDAWAAKEAELKAPEIDTNAPKIDFMTALAKGEKEANRWADK